MCIKQPCRHCGHAARSGFRGLCWHCFHTAEIKAKYPAWSSSGVLDSMAERPLPACPTLAEPGTPEKVAVLEQRAARGEALFHPGDAKFGDALRRASQREAG